MTKLRNAITRRITTREVRFKVYDPEKDIMDEDILTIAGNQSPTPQIKKFCKENNLKYIVTISETTNKIMYAMPIEEFMANAVIVEDGESEDYAE